MKNKKIVALSAVILLLTSGCGRSGLAPVFPSPAANDKSSQGIDDNFETEPLNNQNSIRLILNEKRPASHKLASPEIIASLKKASAGLLMPSESDYPFKTFLWAGQAATVLSNEKLLKLTNKAPGTPVQLTNPENFFREVTRYYDWQSPQERETVRKFRNLVNVLSGNLKNIRVFRIGAVEIDVYITGINNNDFLGLNTKLIETRNLKK